MSFEDKLVVPMRDGTLLATRVWKPSDTGRFPVVLERGYSTGKIVNAESFVSAGYAYVGQKCRGNLEGGMFRTDHEDGYDCLDWISSQSWCNGDIAMYGSSFQGATQWLVAPEQHPNLKAIVPQVINTDPWERMYRDHGALQLSHTARRIYRTVVSPDATAKVSEFGGWWKFYRHLPLITLDEAVVGHKNRLWREYVCHSTYDAYWNEITTFHKIPKIRIPVYIQGGWYDNYPGASFRAFQRLTEIAATDEIRIHVDATDHPGLVVGDRDFGSEPSKPRLQLAIRWLDYVLQGINNGISDEPPVTVFVMGANKWRQEREWPLTQTQFTKFYFHSNGARHGWLDTKVPIDEPPNKYAYDPDDPVLTLGGNHSGPQDHPDVIRVGAIDQRPNWDREDVLVFETPALTTDLEVTGPVTVKLFAASSAPDTDFIARLIDVYPDGTAYNLTDGIIRARFRESIYEPPKLLEPGRTYEYTIDLQPTSNVFKKGHSICVHITSSSFPLWDRNPNTGHEQGMDADMQVAYQTVSHDRTNPSYIILPIIPYESK